MKIFRLKGYAYILAIGFLAIKAHAQDPNDLVQESFNYMRGEASISIVTMTIHRPDWERQMRLQAWTRGQSDSLIRILAPPKDKGNGTLKKGKEMWMFNPKINIQLLCNHESCP